MLVKENSERRMCDGKARDSLPSLEVWTWEYFLEMQVLLKCLRNVLINGSQELDQRQFDLGVCGAVSIVETDAMQIALEDLPQLYMRS